MPTNVIDTNVAIVANGESDRADIDCEIACLEFLKQCSQIDIALDESGLIMDEYRKYLSHAGQPGVGDMFFKYLHDNQYSEGNISLHVITPARDDKGFKELPTNSFDPSDRKFLAVAVVARARVINATDSDWEEAVDLMKQLKIEINQLCPHLPNRGEG